MTARPCHPRAASAILALVLFAFFSGAHAMNTPMRRYLDLPRTDVAMAAAGGIGAPAAQGGGAGTLELEGVSGTVTRALLYWNGIDIEWPEQGYTGGDADYDQDRITFAGQPITGTRIAHGGNNDCWPNAESNPPPSAATWRADVTAIVAQHGNGSYAFDGLAAKPGHSANGLSLIVYFDDGDPANDVHVEHFDGLQSNMEGMHFEITFDYDGGGVEAILHASDGQANAVDGSILWNTLPNMPGASGANTLRYGTLHDGLMLWPGRSVPHMGHARPIGSLDTLWDIRRMPLTPMLGPLHRYTSSFDHYRQQDCVSLHVAQVVRPADPAPPLLSPNPHDFGDVLAGATSAPQRFILTNVMPGPINVQAPTLSGSNRFQLVAETCADRTLAPGATCMVDVSFAPTQANPANRLEAALTVPFKDVAFSGSIPAQAYAALLGAGVPDTPFSRLSFEPPRCHFPRTPLHTTTPNAPALARNTGNLPLTLDAVNAYAPFSLFTTACTAGTTLVPGASCAFDVAFHPIRTQRETASAVFDFHAADAANGRANFPLDGQANLDNETVFADGFDRGACLHY